MRSVVVAGLAFIASVLKFVVALREFLQERDTAPTRDGRSTIRAAAASLLAHLAALQPAGDGPLPDPSPGGTPEPARSDLKACYYRWQAAVWPWLNAAECRRLRVIREAVLGQAGQAANAQWLTDEITQMTDVAVGRAH